MSEIWDAYKKDGTLAGIDLVRGQAIPEGLFHVVGGVMVRHKDGSYLLMQRDRNKQNYPGFWELGASGSILKGETPLQGAERELLEECGITSDGLELIFVTKSGVAFYYNYLCIIGCPKDSVSLQKGETIAYRWIS